MSCLIFRRDSYDLYSGSLDRCIKHWNIAQMGYVETLFGHQSFVTALDAYRKECVVSSGQDRTVRLWKIPEETHLIFQSRNPTLGSAECISCLDDSHFITGSDAGTVALWVREKLLLFCMPLLLYVIDSSCKHVHLFDRFSCQPLQVNSKKKPVAFQCAAHGGIEIFN